ncbi:MAG: branched-chain amino acid transport system ATP-binding protein [Solirubrobacteraceae bacterium]|jgi:branched-chain amino acid transport system ATP-binding protein|nr:branched-chain amino acid transport system ATP-binding protein [Solirubrobacteraceae bacterium]MEA2278367.1 branched-chain amino acid transport system ATP-binding protein [Solirubrobacteraceae bacterium]MEA2393887.1 branched-chain amino acid transport system ATP-binding protein [Solirubrobacteraceae bacterium]
MAVSPDSARLRLTEVSVAFSGVPALEDIDLELSRGEILGLIGPNGAGKTTLINVASGYAEPQHGRVTVDGRDVTGAAPERFARSGVGRTFQAVRLFGKLTVRENVEVAALASGQRRGVARERAARLLEEFGLTSRADDAAASLPYGEERRLALARSLGATPDFLLLDEPAAGLNESETDRLTHAIAEIPERYDCGVLVVEHDMRLIMGLSHRIHVLAHGRTIAIGSPEQVRNDPVVVESYLGKRGAEHALS